MCAHQSNTEVAVVNSIIVIGSGRVIVAHVHLDLGYLMLVRTLVPRDALGMCALVRVSRGSDRSLPDFAHSL